MASLHLAVSAVLPADSAYGSPSNMTVPRRVAKPTPFLYTCHVCKKHFKYRKRMETHQLTCVHKTPKAALQAEASSNRTSSMPNVQSAHMAIDAELSSGTSQSNTIKVYKCMLVYKYA